MILMIVQLMLIWLISWFGLHKLIYSYKLNEFGT